MTSAGASRRQIAGLITTHVSQSYQMEKEASTEGKLC